MKPFTINVDLDRGLITLRRKDMEIGYLKFIYDWSEITVLDITIAGRYRKKGYGEILMYVLMALARKKRRVIRLYSVDTAVQFYEKLGFQRLILYRNGFYEGKVVKFMNVKKGDKPEQHIDELDFIWIPPEVWTAHVYL